MELTTKQKVFFDLVEDQLENKNYFITGKPGTGKSVLINALVELGRKTYHLAAPTGLAALNIGGKTLHSLFRLPILDGILEPDYNDFVQDDRVRAHVKYHIKHLIIDEISMVRADTFDYLNRLCKDIKENDLPFGGIQVVVVGDFYQLPPVSNGYCLAALKQVGYKSHFAFNSAAWLEAGFVPLQLEEVLRQREPAFIKLLAKARIGEIEMADCAKLNKSIGVVEDLRIMLCGTNPQADVINNKHLYALSDKDQHIYEAIEYGHWPAYPVEKIVKLRIGAQVMVKMNGADKPPAFIDDGKGMGEFKSEVVNGTLGIVVGFCPKSTYVVIEIEKGKAKELTQVKIYLRQWTRKVKERNTENKWEEKVVASYEQMPLALAWAISIHKSQGQSFDKVHIDPSRIFAPGQMYVALSRARSLKGVKFSSAINTRKFFADSSVKLFYKSLKI